MIAQLRERAKSSITAFRAWLMQWFGIGRQNVPVRQCAPAVEEEQKHKEAWLESKPARAKSTATQVRPDQQTFSGLLDGLDDSFKTMRIPDIKGNWMASRDVKAIKKLGVYVPTEFMVEIPESPTIPDGTPLPMMASACFVKSGHDTKDKVYPRFVYAIKQPRLPEGVEKRKGVPYQFGYCVEMREKENSPSSPMRMFWTFAWVVVTPDREIFLPRQQIQNVERITHRRAGNGRREEFYVSHNKGQAQAIFCPDNGRDEQELKHFMRCTFRQLIKWWDGRADQWSVGVRKDGHRVTFSIDKRHTAAYFADRNKTASVNGTAKKIIHYVRAHTRGNGQEVRAHVRGLSRFDWRGYQCFVTAPRLNGRVVTVNELSPVFIADDEKTPQGFIGTKGCAKSLADFEDYQDRKADA